ncbi:MAG: SWIM zinc finger family protein [Acidimicrobiales bacterium]
MAGRRWDDPWQRYPTSVPLPAEGGLVTSRRRGAMAATWWSRRFVEVLESYGLGTRMQRGRRYARSGQVLSLDVHAATTAAQVQGSRRTPYLVTVSLPEPTPAQWQAIDAAMRAKVGFAARLLAGEIPADLEEVFRAAGVSLFPKAWKELRARCSCPDWENPCKHIAAVLYVFADQLDTDPWLLLAWRGRSREEILDPLRGSSVTDGATDEVAPWWPFNGSSMPQPGDLPAPAGDVQHADPAHPDAVLDGLEVLDVPVAGVPFREAVSHAYERLVTAAEAEALESG